MQIGKAGVVAAGALATVAAMGTAAAAAPPASVAKADSTPTTALRVDKNQLAKQGLLGLDGNVDQPLITIGVGSSLKAAPWQACGSNVPAGVGLVASAGNANTVIGDCKNANVLLKQDTVPGLISILDDSSVSVLPWQVCGSNAVAGVGATVAVNSPNTVTGDCHNANHVIEAPDGTGPNSFLSVLSGSVLAVAPWQVCGSSAVAGVGAVVAANSPTTVLGDCVNGTVTIEPRANQAEVPILSNVDMTLLPFQWCGENSPLSLVGLVIPLNSPAFVGGECITHP
ncbi:hypothetical protein [Catelliglobosispora koreensis]|uniref:hypothetical protein n=1 Tax=Catelliglobosispora koreensis TaxID=129052 RepID=UPI00037778C5|nr:hypothetical protein [Catelliglobosispora koreensis]